MNETFELSRFRKLFHLHLRTHIVPILVSIGCLVGVSACINAMIMSTDLAKDPMAANFMFKTFGVVGGIMAFFAAILMTVLASRAFNQYHIRTYATPLFMLPSSRLEQFSVMVLLYTFLVPLVMVTAFFLNEIIFLTYGLHKAGIDAPLEEFLGGVAGINDFSVLTILGAYLSYFGWQSLFLMGSVVFRSLSYLKVSSGLVIIFIFMGIFSVVSDSFRAVMKDFLFEESAVRSFVLPIFMLVSTTAIGWWSFRNLKMP